MSAPGYEVARLDELESLPGPGTLRWTPLRRRFGITAYGVNAYTAAQVGQDVVEEHTEQSLGHQELYVVVTGRARFRLGDEDVDAPAGTVVFLRDPAVRRSATAAEAGTTVLAIGGKPGLHDVSEWEYSFAAYGYLKEGDAERGRAVLQEGLADKGESARLLYDLACFESLDGRRDDAIGHLLQAVQLDPRYRQYAQQDADLDAIRDDPRFPT
jgi:tetratricopeptide (TPR) repeat protein